jgi:hypothetical protein
MSKGFSYNSKKQKTWPGQILVACSNTMPGQLCSQGNVLFVCFVLEFEMNHCITTWIKCLTKVLRKYANKEEVFNSVCLGL